MLVTELHLAVPALLSEMARQGIPLTELRTHSATLEDVFVTLTGRHLAGFTHRAGAIDPGALPRIHPRAGSAVLGLRFSHPAGGGPGDRVPQPAAGGAQDRSHHSGTGALACGRKAAPRGTLAPSRSGRSPARGQSGAGGRGIGSPSC